ncbi:hypothetical protein RHGRI_012910 [Rhododendron griersonianum]|uniref:G protein gamma domain-containing protein n=1 Tax=Rhododendron griersonianum TaxID=479676 RepID=A0AAV6K3K2_9ERIC|nr:hypothetical protein RHGRI_012910 [Rhododendron griersonianum]
MAGSSSGVPTLPPPRPKSPPEYPDLYGKRRELAKVQMLEREISFLEGELKFVESLPPASRCCKEVADFAVTNPDPFIPTIRVTPTNTSPINYFLMVTDRLLLVEHPVLTSHGCAVLGASLILKCQAAAAIAAYGTVIHALIVQCQNVGVAPGLARDALTRSHAAAVSVALPGVFRAQIAIVDVVALVLNAQS